VNSFYLMRLRKYILIALLKLHIGYLVHKMCDKDNSSAPLPPALTRPALLMRQINESWWYMGVEGLRSSKTGDEYFITDQYGWKYYTVNMNGDVMRKTTYQGETYLGFSPNDWKVPDHNPENDNISEPDSEADGGAAAAPLGNDKKEAAEALLLLHSSGVAMGGAGAPAK
jgi:hypothetical protein